MRIPELSRREWILAGAVGGLAIVLIVLVATAPRTGSKETLLPTPVGSSTPTARSTATLPFPAIETKTATPTLPPTETPIPTHTPVPTETPTPTPSPSATATFTPTPTPTAIIVNPKVNALGKLETAEFVMQVIVDRERAPRNLWQKLAGSDRLVLVAEGQVVMGFDLTRVEEDDIEVNGSSVRLTLPPPEILYQGIDERNTYIYNRETGLLVPMDPELETEARQIAQQAIVDWALEHDAYAKSEKYGILFMEYFLRSLGFTDVKVTVPREL